MLLQFPRRRRPLGCFLPLLIGILGVLAAVRAHEHRP